MPPISLTPRFNPSGWSRSTNSSATTPKGLAQSCGGPRPRFCAPTGSPIVHFRSLGVRPVVVAGHSFGEYAALVSADVWSITDGLRAARHRAESIEEHAGVDGRMAATTAPPEVIAEVLADNGPHLWVANQNSAQQVVISGATRNVQAAVADLTQRLFGAIVLNVPCPFHSPLLKEAAPELVRRLGGGADVRGSGAGHLDDRAGRDA